MSANGPRQRLLYEFGDFRLDGGRRLLYAKGGSTPLTIKPKVLDALLFFVRHPGELLEKDRLLAELWPGLIVEESGLTQVISTLRRVLRETPGENRYVATVPGRGYTFVAEVEQPSAAAETRRDQPSRDFAVPPVPGRSRRPFFIVAFFALTAAVLILSARRIPRRGQHAPAAASNLRRTNTCRAFRRGLAFEPERRCRRRLVASASRSVLPMAAIGLTLIARTSSFSRGMNAADVRSIGRDLNAISYRGRCAAFRNRRSSS
jgi:DNA-binding winged helix-turn-helix (wHTH) protein